MTGSACTMLDTGTSVTGRSGYTYGWWVGGMYREVYTHHGT